MKGGHILAPTEPPFVCSTRPEVRICGWLGAPHASWECGAHQMGPPTAAALWAVPAQHPP